MHLSYAYRGSQKPPNAHIHLEKDIVNATKVGYNPAKLEKETKMADAQTKPTNQRKLDSELVFALEALLHRARRLKEGPEKVSRVMTLERMLGEARELTGIKETETEVTQEFNEKMEKLPPPQPLEGTS